MRFVLAATLLRLLQLPAKTGAGWQKSLLKNGIFNDKPLAFESLLGACLQESQAP